MKHSSDYLKKSWERICDQARRHTENCTGGLVMPISGGTDSAVARAICIKAVGVDKVTTVFSGDRSQLRCPIYFESRAPVTYLPEVPGWEDKEIMRWAQFLTLAKTQNRWLVGARNLTEERMGTFSMASRVATFLPLAGLWKSEVMALCDFLGIPQEIVQSSRRADPDCGRPHEMAEIPLELIDLFLRAKPESTSVRRLLTPAQITYLTNVRDRNAFKRALPTKAPRVPVLRTEQLAKIAGQAAA